MTYFRYKFWLPAMILRTLEIKLALTRSELVALLGEPRTTVFEHLQKLIAQQKVVTTNIQVLPGRGRPRTFYHLPYVEILGI